jgi:hypothetical protein
MSSDFTEELYELNDVIGAWAADYGYTDPDDPESDARLNDAVHAAANILRGGAA